MEPEVMTRERLKRCISLIAPYIKKTPVMTSSIIDELSGAQLFFKCENFQRGGAYKMRGAIHAMLNLSPEQLKHGVVTHSSGNFAQALALAARELGTTAYIVMPESAPEIKKEAVLAYGGQIYPCLSTLEAREKEADRLVAKTGATFIHPSNDLQVILGQGTAAVELLEEYPNLDNIIVPVGGGGLLGGTAFAMSCIKPHINVFGAEPEEADDAYRSFYSGRIESNVTTNTIADGLRTQLGTYSFPLIREHVSDIILVSESQIIDAMRLIWTRMKLVVEPSSAVALAAVLKDKTRFKNSRTGIVLSGGNVSLDALPF